MVGEGVAEVCLFYATVVRVRRVRDPCILHQGVWYISMMPSR
jgi:hypothetical protein